MQYTELQLKDQNFLNKLKEKAGGFIEQDDINDAYHLAKNIEKTISGSKELRERYYDLYSQYKNIVIKLKWVGLPIMTENMAVEMFEKHFIKIFNIPGYEYNELWRKLKSVLVGIIVLDDRDNFKKRLRSALINNQEKITSKKISVNNKEVEPTVGNWIKDYNSILGTSEIDRLKRTQYLTNNKNIRLLNSDEKKKIKVLFSLYERLKLSSKTFEGLEDEIPLDDEGAKGIIKEGVFEPFKRTREQREIEDIFGPRGSERSDSHISDSYSLEELQNLASQYPAGSLERKAIEEEIGKLKIKS